MKKRIQRHQEIKGGAFHRTSLYVSEVFYCRKIDIEDDTTIRLII